MNILLYLFSKWSLHTFFLIFKVFEWEEEVPLDVWKSIELPQLQLEDNYTNDCTQVYATGELCATLKYSKKALILHHVNFQEILPVWKWFLFLRDGLDIIYSIRTSPLVSSFVFSFI